MNTLVYDANEINSTIIRFGDAQLILRENGRNELIGGSPSDQIAAREYISLFLHEVIVNSPSRGGRGHPIGIVNRSTQNFVRKSILPGENGDIMHATVDENSLR